MKPRRAIDGRWIGGALALLLTAAVAAWFFANFERREEVVEVGLRGEARLNRFLAAQRLLERLGDKAEGIGSLDRLFPLPAEVATLLIPTPRQSLSEGQFEALRRWVEGGGHLILVIWSFAEDEQAHDDPLLEALGVGQLILTQEELVDKGPTPVPVDGGETPLLAAFDPQYVLEDRDQRAYRGATDGNGPHLLGFHLGRGELTVLTDAELFDNRHIGDHDHAALLWHLAHLGGRDGRVWLVYGDDMPPLWDWLLNHASEALISGALLLLAWLWHASRRFGPLLPEPLPARRSLREHLHAAGTFIWRHEDEQVLVQATREALRERIGRTHPGWNTLPPAELHARLAQRADLSPDMVRDALEGRHAALRRLIFTHRIRTLETIRNAL